MPSRSFVHFYILLLPIVLNSSCTESLPLLNDPNDVFDGTAAGLYPTPDNSMQIQLTVRNVFDETFQGRGVLRGSLTIELQRDPTHAVSIPISPANLIHGNYNTTTGQLTIDPNAFVVLAANWNFVDSNGANLANQVLRMVNDTSCSGRRRLAYEEHFTIRAAVRLYDRTGDVHIGPADFSLCYVDNILISNRECPTPTYRPPCGVR
jgi:hypothetical protein